MPTESHRTDEPALPDRIGPYRILDELGEGGMGTVYLGEHIEIGRKAAIKRVRLDSMADAATRTRFDREVRALSQLDHPNICKVFEVGDDQGVPFMAMQWVDGSTLQDWLEQQRDTAPVQKRVGRASSPSSSGPRKRQDIEATVHRIEKIARALHTAHEQQILHRDIKPGNIMLAAEGEPIVLDFGLARDESSVESRQTSSGALLGTLLYMAPEQVRGDIDKISRQTDIFALGVVLYECLTLQLPFRGRSQAQIMREIEAAAPVAASRINRAVPYDLQVVLEKAMDQDPKLRYATALAFAEDLERVRKFEPIHASRLGMGLRLRRWSQRNQVASVGIFLLGMGLTAAIILSLKLSQARDDQAEAAELARNEKARAEEAAAESAMAAAALAVSHGRWVQALAHYDEAARTEASDPIEIALGRVDALENLSRVAEANQIYRWLEAQTELGTHSAAVRLALGLRALESSPRRGERLVREALEDPHADQLDASDRAHARGMLAEDLNDAISHFEQALDSNPRHLATLRALGIIYPLAGRSEEALELADDFGLLFEDAPDPHLIRGLALATLGRSEDARAALSASESLQFKLATPLVDALCGVFDALEIGIGRATKGAQQFVLNTVPRGGGSFPTPPGVLETSPPSQVALQVIGPILKVVLAGVAIQKSAERGNSFSLPLWFRNNYPVSSASEMLMFSLRLKQGGESAVGAVTGFPEAAMRITQIAGGLMETFPQQWTALTDAQMANFRGLSSNLPAVRRLHITYRHTINAACRMLGHLPEGHDEASMKRHAAADLDALLEIPGVTEIELLSHLMLAVNTDVDEDWTWSDRVLLHWREIHGETVTWHLTRAEILRIRGWMTEAGEALERARELDPDHPWVAALATRIPM